MLRGASQEGRERQVGHVYGIDLKKGVTTTFRSLDIEQLNEISTVTREPTDKKPVSSPGAVDFSSVEDAAEAKHLDELLDEALIETFPASDPVAITIERDVRHRHSSPPSALSARAAAR